MISHLQFADDTLISIDASVEKVQRLFIILDIFETLTGMKLNLEKSTMISVGADNIVDLLAKELGCKTEKLLFKYLGLLIGALSRSISVWDVVLERMELKLSSWKKKFLNKAVDGKKKTAWVSWKKVCVSKSNGGLVLKILRNTNKTLLIKWVWRYSKTKTALWRRIIQQKQKVNEDVALPTEDNSAQGRSLWRNVSNLVPEIQHHISFKLNNGRGIRFWYDKWCGRGVLKDRFPVIFKAVKDKQMVVAGAVKEGRWFCIFRKSHLNANEKLE
ncbi:uncharacterized protein LOC113290558 [Papaver somniferum]|uniref:uncharacterized protein LOC113290558 n=1 Tax=Papaver somniferum TaxID=3469 RepID=UPI000E6FAA70|nr:uncharacterized protein LOC113290558 [Papaver somniferum]